MAINYEQVGWDTSKYVNPTRMNHMDDGIKKACDKVDEHDQRIDTINSNLISLNKFKFNTELTTSNISFQLDKRYDVYIINLITDKNDVFKTVTVMEEIDESDGNMLVEISSPWGTTPAKVLINFDNIQYFNINVSIRELGSFTKVTLSSIIGIKLPLS